MKLLCCLDIHEVLTVVFDNADAFNKHPELYEFCHVRKLTANDFINNEVVLNYNSEIN